MTAGEVGFLILAFVGGLALAAFHFGGLWLTVRRLPTSKRPELLTLGSFFLRIAVTLAAMYFLMDGRWQRLAVCVLGFIAGRMVLMKIFGGRTETPAKPVAATVQAEKGVVADARNRDYS